MPTSEDKRASMESPVKTTANPFNKVVMIQWQYQALGALLSASSAAALVGRA